MARALIKKNHGGKGKEYFIYQLNIWLWCSKKPSQRDGSLHHMFWLIKRKFVFYHAHFHVGYLDACEKTVYILSENHIMTKPKK